MREMTYIRPGTIGEAVEAVARNGPSAAILAGGTDLLIEWRRTSLKNPVAVVDISRLTELMGIAAGDGVVTIGALTTHTQILESEILKSLAPLLSKAASTIGSVQIRNRGTVGGNIMNAATCADSIPPLVALGAEVELHSTSGKRSAKLDELFSGPYQTTTTPDEVLTRIRFPRLPVNARTTFIKLGRRNALSISRLSVAAIVIRNASGTIVDARIVPGAAFPTWRRVAKAEAMLVGERPTTALFTAAGKVVAEEMIAVTGRRWSTEYKEPVIAVLVWRALESCVQEEEHG